MHRLIEGIDFSRRAHFDCTEQALEVALRFHGYELEDILFDEWRFVYLKAEDQSHQFQLGPGVPPDMGKKFLDFGITLRYQQAGEFADAWSAIKQLIDQGRPVPVWVDPYYLGYYAPANPRHTGHSVVVDGYNEEQDTAHIVDPSPWQLFKDYIPLSNLEESMGSSHHRDNSERNSWVEFDFPAPSVGRDSCTLRAKIKDNVEAMLPGREGETVTEEGIKVKAMTGLRGVREFALDLEGWGNREPDWFVSCMPQCREPLQQVGRRLYGHACFLASAGKTLRSEKLDEIAQEVEKIAEAWFLPANLFFKGRKEPAAMLPRIKHRLLGIADRQERVLVELKEVVD